MRSQRILGVRTPRAAACTALVLLLAAAPAWGQSRGRIAGQVTDAGTGETLPGVNVVLVGSSLGTATDIVGEYTIANLQIGTYEIRATYIGYDTLTVVDVQINPNATTTLDIVLHETTLAVGGEVEVTAQMPLVERDNTASVTRIETEEIAARPTTDLTQVLTTLPSINVENGEITVRGRTLDEVAFMVDGARARNPLNHDPYTRVNLSAIQELEVITGGYNAEYGEAQSGVINVITKEGDRDRYEVYLDTRYTPPGQRHFGTAFYDRSSPLFWENTHAMHLEWWVENPDQWRDPNGVRGSDTGSTWTPEQAYEAYLATHQPLTDYTNTPGYQVELGLGGPLPALRGMTFYGTVKYREEAPLFGNAYRNLGQYLDGNLKVAVPLGRGMKLLASGFYGRQETGWGFQNDYFWASTYGTRARYAFYDFEGLPYEQTNGQGLQFSHALNTATLYELRLARVQAIRRVDAFPDDPLGFEGANGPTPSPLESPDPGGDRGNPVGFNTTGYYFRYDDDNTEWAFHGTLRSQLNQHLAVQTGTELSYYVLDHFNQAKAPNRVDDRTYRPYQGALYAQGKAEYGGLIVNGGLRLDFYNANDTLYTNIFAPFDGGEEATTLFTQLSPRLGISHPIDARTVFHFSYGHFFQRPPFNDYGEGNAFAGGSLNTFLGEGGGISVLGNRNLRPQQTIAFEAGVERNFWDFFIFDLTAYYKDIRNTIRTVRIETPLGSYYTNANGDYADERGVEVSLRKVPSTYGWGTVSGYANFTTSLGIFGRSGSARAFSYRPEFVPPDPGSGDVIIHSNPQFKLGFYYQTPLDWQGPLGAVLGGWSLALDYRANLPNEQIRSDFFLFEGVRHMRPWDHTTDLRLRREIALPRGMGTVSPYLEVSNVLNTRWIFLQAVEQASVADQRAFVESGFDDLPEVDSNGDPILDVGLYRNLPRAVVFGATFAF